MKPTLKTGLRRRFAYKVPASKTVPHTYPEAPEIASMPDVFATGYMIALMEWTSMQLLAPHLDAGEGSVDVSHIAATPVGMTVTVDVECVEIVGPRIAFTVKAHDGVDVIGEGRHQRFIVEWDKFKARLATKAAKVGEWRMASGEQRMTSSESNGVGNHFLP
jgi:fluoroacetyl-CoA thioesterase